MTTSVICCLSYDLSIELFIAFKVDSVGYSGWRLEINRECSFQELMIEFHESFFFAYRRKIDFLTTRFKLYQTSILHTLRTNPSRLFNPSTFKTRNFKPLTMFCRYTAQFVCFLFVFYCFYFCSLRFNIPINDFSVMLGWSHRFLGIYQYLGSLKCLAQGHYTTVMGFESWTSSSGV